MASNELIPKEESAVADQKMVELSDAVVQRANTDRQTAKEVYDFVRKEITDIEEDYNHAREIYDAAFEMISTEQNEQIRAAMMCKLGRPPRKQNVVNYIEQMNRAVENSIKSTANINELLNTIARIATARKVKVDTVNINNRSLLLEEIIEEEKKSKLNTNI